MKLKACSFLGLSILLLAMPPGGLKSQESAPAQPFGLQMGMTKNQLKIARDMGSGIFQLTDVPNPHPIFKDYYAEVTPKAGLCWIKAISNDVKSSGSGFEVKSEFEKIKIQIDGVYSNTSINDILMSGSLWTEPQYWMMGLLKKDRIYSAKWSREDKSLLKPTLDSVYLSVRARSTEAGVLDLEYYFQNYSDCEKEISNQQKSVF